MTINTKDFIDENYGLFINGQYVASDSGDTLEVPNPATGEVLAKVAKAQDRDVDKAVKAAHDAFEGWSQTSKSERAELLRQIGDKILENKDKFATIESLNTGKPIRETKATDIPFAAKHYKYFASVIDTDEGSVNNIDKDVMSIVRHEPNRCCRSSGCLEFPILIRIMEDRSSNCCR